MEPWRAWPVPFCLHGFLPPPRNLGAGEGGLGALALVGQVVHDRAVQDGGLLGSMPKTASDSSIVADCLAGHIKNSKP